MDIKTATYPELKAHRDQVDEEMQKRRDDALDAFKKTAAALDMTDDQPKRKRRTRAEIEADNAAQL